MKTFEEWYAEEYGRPYSPGIVSSHMAVKAWNAAIESAKEQSGEAVNQQLLGVARSILAEDMLLLLPAEYVAKVRAAIAAAEAAQPAPAVPEGWRDMVSKAHRFIRDVGEHAVTCAIYDLDEDGKHIQCTCGMDETLRGLKALLDGAPTTQDGVCTVWDVFNGKEWFMAVTSPVGWDAKAVSDSLTAQHFAPHLNVMARHIVCEGNPIAGLMAEVERLREMLAAAPQPAQKPAFLQAYRAKLKSRKQMERDIPPGMRGWWFDVSAGCELRLRQATQSDVDRCTLADKASSNPDDYMCEIFERGSLVSKIAIEFMNAERNVFVAAPQPAQQIPSVIEEIAAERRRQIEVEGWTPEHDDQHRDYTLAGAAGCYAMHTLAFPAGDPPQPWPWDKSWWKPSPDKRRNWIKAAALLVAAIEREDRMAAPQPKEGGD
ncbi:hypothetical protein [Chromobacterium violaceum]|uniref:hypothetical protein n=1 Tax=Chromobacterium violaceum TaxID=536 RepID=UPI001CE0FE65|nr:hypothetical protein [Chromobacterium violaceum]